MDQLHRNWGWLMALGVLMVVVGSFAIVAAGVATWASIVFFGILLVVSGVAQMLHAFSFRLGHGFGLTLLCGVLYTVVGVMMFSRPGMGAFSVTLLLTAFLLVGGVYRAVFSAITRYPRWGWGLFSGLVTAALGLYIGATLPYSAIWVIGTFIGVEMMLSGWSSIMLASAARTWESPMVTSGVPITPSPEERTNRVA